MKIILTTINSTYQHSSFGLRYLYANMEELREQTEIVEFTLQKSPQDIAETILSQSPQILGLGVYIWNARQSLDLVRIIKKLSPKTILVLGGPEVSYETESQEISQYADYVIQGEGDFAFRDLCRKINAAGCDLRQVDYPRVHRPPLPNIHEIKLPYIYYSDEDIRNRYIYVEASRGCPYKCEYCLSSLDKSVRSFSLDILLQEFSRLIDRGANQFKFIDRTFNLNPTFCTQILEYFLKYIQNGKELFLHFEMVPDRLPEEIKLLIAQFPEGSLQFEVGIQTFNIDVAKNVSRRNDFQKVRDNFQFLRENTRVHTHADLIVGLPGENIASFAKGFDQLLEYGPSEIQVGILKRLKGTPIVRHDRAFAMNYQDHPPFQILSTKDVSFTEMQMMNRFSKHWDWYANSGQFITTMQFLISSIRSGLSTHGQPQPQEDAQSFFYWFLQFSKMLSHRFPNSHGVALLNQVESLWSYICDIEPQWKTVIREKLIHDYSVLGKRDIPKFLREESGTSLKNKGSKENSQTNFNQRQQRHQSAAKVTADAAKRAP